MTDVGCANGRSTTAETAMTTAQRALVTFKGAGKSFGAVRALCDVDLSIAGGECLGLIGHNGAGKSTLMQVLAGTLAADCGELLLDGQDVRASYSVQVARKQGIRCVFQELSLCPNLSVAENTRLMSPAIRGWGWRRKATALIEASLDEIFPGHGIRADEVVAELPIGKRQMVEIARAFVRVDERLDLVILDEPTSSLDSRVAEQLLQFVRRFVVTGGSIVLISHILGEMLDTCDRIAVMRDGRVVEIRPAADFTHASLVECMGSAAKPPAEQQAFVSRRAQGTPVVALRPARQGNGQTVDAYPGEIVGLAGLAGHGQSQWLIQLLRQRVASGQGAALVAGDRQTDGVFAMWSIAENITISSLGQLKRGGLIDPDAEQAMAAQWQQRMGIRTPDMGNPILSLSGGNQQKALFARALASRNELILMDDPMRGVDVGTKREVYSIIAQEAAKGRTFIWYTTELEELDYCDHIYVFRDGQAVLDLPRSELSEEQILRCSFEEQTA